MSEDFAKLSLSTCWLSHRHTDGYEMVKEIIDLGFTRIELSHGIRISLVPGILKALNEGLVQISSVHNFCPLPTGIMTASPNLYEPTAADPRERAAWVRYTRNTLDFARRIGCDLAVLHSGSVRFFFGNPRRTIDKRRKDRSKEELLSDAGFQRLLVRTLEKVRRRSGKFRARLVESLREVLPYAQERGVRLALENREGLLELPMEDEWPDLLAEFPSANVGYWHDSGHAQLKEQLGVCAHEKLLRENNERLYGFHLHDVSPRGSDHQIPGSGTIDWEMLRSYVRPSQIFVLELSPRLSPEDVIASRDFITRTLGISA